MNDKPILVTGGAGYIGAHACKALAAAGYLPVTYDNLIYGHKWAVNWGPLEVGDLHDTWRLQEVIKRYRPIAAMHFAAYAYVGESVGDPDKYYHNNVSGSINLLRSLLRLQVRHMVFSSTCATYGIPTEMPIHETHAQAPVNPYGKSKLMIENILRDYDAAYGLRFVALRYFNAAGADPDGEIGEHHDPETHAIPLAIQTALGQRPQFEIFGNDYPTDDGSAVRDYTHVSDLASAHVLALAYLLEGNPSRSFNLGTGRGHSVKELIASVERVTCRPVAVKEAPRRPGDPAVLVADALEAREVLGWQPRFRELDPMVETAVRWHADRG